MSTAAVSVARRQAGPRSWVLWLLAAPAAVAVWSGWVGLGRMVGFGPVNPLPGIWDSLVIDTAITLPIGVEAYAAYALRAWLAGRPGARSTRFARASALASLFLGAGGQVAYHLMEASRIDVAPWWITAVVSILPVAVLGMGASLAHLIHADRHTPNTEPTTPAVPIDDAHPMSVVPIADARPAPATHIEDTGPVSGVPIKVTPTSPTAAAASPGGAAGEGLEPVVSPETTVTTPNTPVTQDNPTPAPDAGIALENPTPVAGVVQEEPASEISAAGVAPSPRLSGAGAPSAEVVRALAEEKPWLTRAQLAAELGTSTRTVQRRLAALPPRQLHVVNGGER